MSEETAPVRDQNRGERWGAERPAGIGVDWDAIISPRMHLFSAMFLLVMLAGMPSEVSALACHGKALKLTIDKL